MNIRVEGPVVGYFEGSVRARVRGRPWRALTLAILAAGTPIASAAGASAQTVAITNARIHTVAGPVIERGTVVVRDGLIEAVGADVSPPAGVRVIDAAGKTVTPGLLDSSTTLGLVEIGQIAGTNDVSSGDDRITAALRVLDAVNPQSTVIPVTRVEGITRAVVRPQAGPSLIAGAGALLDLGGERVNDMVHADPVAMFAVLGEAGAARAGGSRSAAVLRLREALEDARDYAANRTAFEQNQRRDYALSRLDLEALLPVVRGELPLAVEVHRASDILTVLRLADELDLRIILTGVTEGWLVAPEIAAADVPVVINPMTNIPGFENLNITLENAARLHDAGVTVAFATFDTHNARNLKYLAGNAVAYGMPHEAALRAVTATPAAIWGIADRYGTLEPGRQADVVIWSGDPFELTTVAEHVFIEGREVPQQNRQRMLFERYRTIDR